MLPAVNTIIQELRGHGTILIILSPKFNYVQISFLSVQQITELSQDPDIKNFPNTAKQLMDPLWPFKAIGNFKCFLFVQYIAFMGLLICQSRMVKSLDEVTNEFQNTVKSVIGLRCPSWYDILPLIKSANMSQLLALFAIATRSPILDILFIYLTLTFTSCNTVPSKLQTFSNSYVVYIMIESSAKKTKLAFGCEIKNQLFLCRLSIALSSLTVILFIYLLKSQDYI